MGYDTYAATSRSSSKRQSIDSYCINYRFAITTLQTFTSNSHCSQPAIMESIFVSVTILLIVCVVSLSSRVISNAPPCRISKGIVSDGRHGFHSMQTLNIHALPPRSILNLNLISSLLSIPGLRPVCVYIATIVDCGSVPIQ